MAKAKTEKKEKKSKLYKLTILTNESDKQVFETDDLIQTLKDFKPEGFFKTDTLVTLESEGKKSEWSLNVANARRIFSNGVAAEILAKNLKLMLK